FLYSKTGKPSIDPIVFFKCMLIGYLENVCSDRALERYNNMRMDLRFFIDHDIDEPTPDHSTFCKSRKRIPIEVFQEGFDYDPIPYTYTCSEGQKFEY
ncbi:MAG: transposase, partial [Saprospiraceae bacterium]|nr:transposase [Saprospiraceae bacterium]